MSELLIRFALLLMRAVARLPYPVVRRLGEAAGSLAWVLAVPRRRVTHTNLRMCFPQWSEARRRAVARGHFRYFMRSFFERFIFWYGTPAKIRRLCRLEGLEHFEKHLGRPVILLGPHLVGLDAGGIRFSLDFPCASMYAAQKSRALNEAMTRGRTRFDSGRMLLRTEGLRPAVKVLREGCLLYTSPSPRDRTRSRMPSSA